jgi:hypothetical protein
MHIMKQFSLCLLFLVCLSRAVDAQPKAAILPEPASWQLEQFPLPPGFAPTLPYKGLEELRFSPDMFNKGAINYFTYVFAARLDNTVAISASDIKNYLLIYFKGLCGKTAADRKLPPVDTAAISVAIAPKKTADKTPVYSITLHAFGVFADGAPVILNIEAKVFADAPHQRAYLLFIVSPQPTTAPIWQDLYKVQQTFVLPVG